MYFPCFTPELGNKRLEFYGMIFHVSFKFVILSRLAAHLELFNIPHLTRTRSSHLVELKRKMRSAKRSATFDHLASPFFNKNSNSHEKAEFDATIEYTNSIKFLLL